MEPYHDKYLVTLCPNLSGDDTGDDLALRPLNTPWPFSPYVFPPDDVDEQQRLALAEAFTAQQVMRIHDVLQDDMPAGLRHLSAMRIHLESPTFARVRKRLLPASAWLISPFFPKRCIGVPVDAVVSKFTPAVLGHSWLNPGLEVEHIEGGVWFDSLTQRLRSLLKSHPVAL